jgi:acyl-CoA thioester hydrolase
MAPFAHRLRVRYHECDQQGIVFNAHHFAYFDVVLTELWGAAFGSYGAMVESGTDVMVVEAQASFRAPARFDDVLDLSMSIARLGNTSIVSELEERRAGELLATGRLVHVCVDTATAAKKPIPEDMRARLAPWTAT